MLKDFKRFVNETVENKGVGPGNDNTLFGAAPFKQKLNQPNQTMDFLRQGKQIVTENIDGFIDSVRNNSILILDRLTGEIKTYSIKQVLKEISKSDKKSGRKINEQLEVDEDRYTEDFDISDEEEITDEEDLDNLPMMNVNHGTEDNPEGLPGKGEFAGNEEVWESWNVFENYDPIVMEDEEEEEEEDEDEEEEEDYGFRGTEDNPIDTNRRGRNLPSEFE